MACGAVLIPFSSKRTESAVFAVGTNAVLFFVLVILAVRPTMWTGFDLRPLAGSVASHDGNVAWYGSYHGQLNYLGKIRHVAVPENPDDLAEWLKDHRDGVLVVRLSYAMTARLKDAGIDASNSKSLSSAQAEQITQILRSDSEFPGHKWQPTVTDLHWIRTGLPLVPFVVTRFDNPPR
jgi:hypothetical protein